MEKVTYWGMSPNTWLQRRIFTMGISFRDGSKKKDKMAEPTACGTCAIVMIGKTAKIKVG